MKFHFQRLRAGSIRQKVEYVLNALQHGWETMLESLFTRHRPLLMSLQRVLGFSVPEALFKNTWARAGAFERLHSGSIPRTGYLVRAPRMFRNYPKSDETLGWKEVADDGVEVVFVPGRPRIHVFRPTLSLSAGVCVRSFNRPSKTDRPGFLLPGDGAAKDFLRNCAVLFGVTRANL